jgi:crotonobetainyl-CoA:carnitine CoA-transferase CaiB-like acyl-CoA transferase
MGREDLVGDSTYATPDRRLEREAEVDAIIASWTRRHTKHEAMRAVGDAGIPAGAVLDTMELESDQTFEQRGILQVMRHPVHRDFKMPGWPVRIDGKPPALKSSPVLGADTEHVLDEWLGLNAQAVAALRDQGAV